MVSRLSAQEAQPGVMVRTAYRSQVHQGQPEKQVSPSSGQQGKTARTARTASEVCRVRTALTEQMGRTAQMARTVNQSSGHPAHLEWNAPPDSPPPRLSSTHRAVRSSSTSVLLRRSGQRRLEGVGGAGGDRRSGGLGSLGAWQTDPISTGAGASSGPCGEPPTPPSRLGGLAGREGQNPSKYGFPYLRDA